jgi:glycosyltransferase involved in cell wall biosynthesis
MDGIGSVPRYVLVSPARNEVAHIGKTLESVVSQTMVPIRYVVVSDGSTDGTDRIVEEYSSQYDFIELVRREPEGERDFGSKVFALRAGIQRLKDLDYDFIGNLDADVSFGPDYYERVLGAFAADPELGIAGGVVHDRIGDRWVRQVTNTEWSVAGAVQMFRRECFETIGGYMPLRRGGIDAVAEIQARMHGYRVRAFDELPVRHHQLMGTKGGDILQARHRQGRMEYAHGYHPLFETGRCLIRIRERPYVVGSLCRLAGFWMDLLRRVPRDVPDEVVEYLRREQRGRMRAWFRGGPGGEVSR